MPPYKFNQPRSLQALASARISNLAVDSCLQIQRRLPESQHLIEAKKIQQYLLKIRPLLDDIFNMSLASTRRQHLGLRGEVMLTALMHPNMKIIRFPFDLFCNHENCINWDFGLWKTYLEQVPNLIELDLMGVTSQLDGILEVVERSCPKLEIISICFNGVTTEGMFHLANIKSLRIISFEQSSSRWSNPYLTKFKDIRLLVQQLPLLEKISYNYVGQLLAGFEDTESLSLIECVDSDINQERLQAIVKFCPKLVSLTLGTETLLFNLNLMDLDLTPITESSLQIANLTLSNLKIHGTFEHFFIKKGIFIVQLTLWGISFTDSDVIPFLVGMHCPMVEKLHITIKHKNIYNLQRILNMPTSAEKPIFQNLLQFNFGVLCFGYNLDIVYPCERIVPCLVFAKKIQSLIFHLPKQSDNVAFERAMSNLLVSNPMADLEEFEIYCRTIESIELVTNLFNLPKLTSMTFRIVRSTFKMEEHFEKLRSLISYKNFNLTLSA